MENEIFFESIVVSKDISYKIDREYDNKLEEIIKEIINIMNEKYSLKIDIKNKCIN
tara:strand:- start:442 stop:609 length:168 start_codon:yes stop_codon:yes gene_type:complete